MLIPISATFIKVYLLPAVENDINQEQLCCIIAKRLLQQNPDLDQTVALNLAIKFNIMSDKTAFVAVSDHVTNIKEDETNKVVSLDGINTLKSLTSYGEMFECCAQIDSINMVGDVHVFSLQSASLSSSSGRPVMLMKANAYRKK